MDTITLKADAGFEQVMEFYMPMVYRIAVTRIGSRIDAEDITQDVFVRYFKIEPKFDSEDHRKAWFIRCTINHANNYAASAWFKHRTSGIRLENMPKYDNGMDDVPDRIEQRASVMAAVMRLPKKYRTVVHLFYFEDMSVADICQAVGAKESTVKSQLKRARDMLRPMLEEVDF